MSKLGVCVIGSGRAGMIHAANYAKNVPDAKLIAMVDPVEKAAKNACEELGTGTYYADYRRALENKDIDAVIIVTPTKFHADIAVDAANAGKHILCEKPMAMTVGECRRMIEAAGKNKVLLQIGFMRRFDSGFKRAKGIVESGAIGDLVMVRSTTRGPSVPQPWMYDIKKSNGPLAEVNSHDVDTLRWFSGSEFESVYAIGGNYRCPDAREDFPDFYDNVILSARLENGMQGMIDGAQGVGYAYDARVEILGTKGCVFIGRVNDDAVVTCTADSAHGSYPLVRSWRQLFSEAYLNEDAAFIECIQKGKPSMVTGHDGKMAAEVVDAGNISIAQKKIVYLNELTKEEN